MTSGKNPEAEQPEEEATASDLSETGAPGDSDNSAEKTADPNDDNGADAGEDETTAADPEPEQEVELTPEEQISDLKDNLLRVMAESENVRKRARRDVTDAAKYGVTNFARDTLSIGDNLARALESVPPQALEENETLKTLIEGVELTQREFLAMIERHGIKRIEPIGEKFDHNFHQAMFEVEDPSQEPGTIIQVVQPGYVISDRLLRAAMVGVSKRVSNAAPNESGETGESDDSPPHIDTKV